MGELIPLLRPVSWFQGEGGKEKEAAEKQGAGERRGGKG